MTIAREDLEAGRVDLSDLADPGQPMLGPVHPGEILKDWLDDAGLSANALAKALHVPHNRITGILRGERSITGETALRLARYFGTSASYWVNLQAHHDLEAASLRHRAAVEREVAPRSA